MSSVAFDLKGVKELAARLQSLASATPKYAEAALRLEGERIMTASKRIVPVDLGTLKSSGHVTSTIDPQGNSEVSLSYGGAAADYALVQHEHTEFAHKGQGQAKYLERPFNDAISGMPERLAQSIANAVETSGKV